ncbi:MAG: dienelactone hydrolase family protein [Acidimicrobiales bacterium]
MTESNVLEGFQSDSFTSSTSHGHNLYRLGSGPAVIIVHEIPGITPLVAAFARRVAHSGLTAVLPDLFGTPGKEMTMNYALNSFAKACISKEFTILAHNRTSPIVDYLRELATREHSSCGGLGVGAIGMCLTGGFALAMSVEPVVIAPIMSQPSLPLPINAAHRRALGLSDSDYAVVRERVNEGLCVMGLRFSGDNKSPRDRFVRMRQELGDNFIGVEIDSSATNPWGYKKGAHSVLTEDYSDTEGSPTRAALDQVLHFLVTTLGVEPTPTGEP